MPRALTALLTLAVLTAPSPAGAWVRTTNANGVAVTWQNTNCLVMRIDANGSDDISGSAEITAARKSWANWRNATRGCSYIRFKELQSQKNLTPAYNSEGTNENIITWVESGWTYSAFAVALTKVSFFESKQNPGEGQDGRILDADIIFNGQHLRFGATGDPNNHDVENTLTHELGHALGLDHPCDDGTLKTVPKDNKGNTIPTCGTAAVTNAMKESTMYNFALLGETKKRSLSSDDINAICDMYPKSDDPGVCQATNIPEEYSSGGCAVAPFPSPGIPLLLLGALLALGALTRRRC